MNALSSICQPSELAAATYAKLQPVVTNLEVISSILNAFVLAASIADSSGSVPQDALDQFEGVATAYYELTHDVYSTEATIVLSNGSRCVIDCPALSAQSTFSWNGLQLTISRQGMDPQNRVPTAVTVSGPFQQYQNGGDPLVSLFGTVKSMTLSLFLDDVVQTLSKYQTILTALSACASGPDNSVTSRLQTAVSGYVTNLKGYAKALYIDITEGCQVSGAAGALQVIQSYLSSASTASASGADVVWDSSQYSVTTDLSGFSLWGVIGTVASLAGAIVSALHPAVGILVSMLGTALSNLFGGISDSTVITFNNDSPTRLFAQPIYSKVFEISTTVDEALEDSDVTSEVWEQVKAGAVACFTAPNLRLYFWKYDGTHYAIQAYASVDAIWDGFKQIQPDAASDFCFPTAMINGTFGYYDNGYNDPKGWLQDARYGVTASGHHFCSFYDSRNSAPSADTAAASIASGIFTCLHLAFLGQRSLNGTGYIMGAFDASAPGYDAEVVSQLLRPIQQATNTVPILTGFTNESMATIVNDIIPKAMNALNGDAVLKGIIELAGVVGQLNTNTVHDDVFDLSLRFQLDRTPFAYPPNTTTSALIMLGIVVGTAAIATAVAVVKVRSTIRKTLTRVQTKAKAKVDSAYGQYVDGTGSFDDYYKAYTSYNRQATVFGWTKYGSVVPTAGSSSDSDIQEILRVIRG